MIHRKITSSNIKSVGFDASSKTMEVVFQNGGHYQYRNVTSAQHTALLKADSAGSWLAENIVKRPMAHPAKKMEVNKK